MGGLPEDNFLVRIDSQGQHLTSLTLCNAICNGLYLTRRNRLLLFGTTYGDVMDQTFAGGGRDGLLLLMPVP